MKLCSKCRQVNDTTYGYYCKACNRLHQRAWVASRPNPREHSFSVNIKHRYGLTLEQYYMLLQKQDQKCKLCKQPFKTTKDTHIDHKHGTKQIRGILCVNCNTGLGKFGDDINTLKRAINYLEEFN